MTDNPQDFDDVPDLTTLTFRLCRADGSFDVAPVRLLPEGKLEGYYHRNEAAWGVVDGDLALMTVDGHPSTVFNRAFKVDGRLVLEGDFLLHPEMKVVHQLRQIEWGFAQRKRHERLTSRHLAAQIDRYGWVIGDHTYGVPNVIEIARAKLRVGKFCSIADGVSIVLANHKIDGVTTYPFSSLQQFWPSLENVSVDDHVAKGDISIGHDVWIGYGATILSGVTIGDGAVIAAHSVITKDVAPFAVYGGNPARLLKFRHSAEDIEHLCRIAWWDWPDEVLNQRLPLMMSDLRGFINHYSPLIEG